jgi:hypothetical protein
VRDYLDNLSLRVKAHPRFGDIRRHSATFGGMPVDRLVVDAIE